MGLEAATFVNDLVVTNPIGATDPKGQGDDHIRMMKAALKATFPLAIGARKFQDLDAGATDTLPWTLYRKSASPAAADLLGSYNISGDNASAVEKVYASWQARIDDATAGSEDGAWLANVMVAGAVTTLMTINAAGITLANNLPVIFSGTGAASTLTSLGGQPLDAGLTNLAAFNTNGILTQTANDTFVGRTLTGTAAEITVTNGAGTAGNPTLSLPAALTFTGKTITGGTFASITATSSAFNGTIGATTPSTISATTLALSGVLSSSSSAAFTQGVVASNFQAAVATPTQAILATNGASAGTVILRPNGAGSTTGQATIDSAGNAVIAGTLTVGGNPVRAIGQSATLTLAAANNDITGIPAGVKQVIVSINRASFNASSELWILAGSSGGFLSSYGGSVWANGGSIGNYTTSIRTANNSAADVANITLIMNLQDAASNTWNFMIMVGLVTPAFATMGAGDFTLPGALDRIRLTTASGTAVADGGSMSVQYY